MDEQRASELMQVYRSTLLDNVVPFWMRYALDREYGGYMLCVDRDGTRIDTDKGVWQQARTAWLFGELYNTVEPRSEWLEAARLGIEFMDRHCFDPADGRMWFHVTRDGRPIRKRRYAFSESFAAIAYAEFAQATGSDEYAEKARRTFQRFIDHNLHPQGVTPKFTDTRPLQSIGFPMITINTAQQLRDTIALETANQLIDEAINSIVTNFVKEDIQCVMESVSPDGQLVDHIDGRTLNPGHAIEAAWFIMAEGNRRDDRGLIALGCRMLEWMWGRGWDEQYGGMLYFVDVNGRPVQEYWHDMKFWWPHNETILATLLAHLLTGDEKYADWHRQVHDWSFTHFPDSEHGEWYGYLHRDGSVSVALKGNLWKGPFHLPRMLLNGWRALERRQSFSQVQ